MRASAGVLSRVPASLPRPALSRVRRGVTVLRRALGLLSLAALVYLSAAIATGAAAAPSRLVPARYGGFPSWLRGPLDGIGLPLSREGFVVAVAAMFGAYLVALLCVGALHARWTLAAVVLGHIVFLLGPPLLSADVMGYLDWARMGALHGLNPYVHASGSVVSDAVHPFVRWDRFTSPYGPLFTLLSYALVPLGPAGSLWALKGLVTLASLGTCAAIWDGAGCLGLSRGPALALYGLNPVVLVFAVGGAHNDLIAMAFVLGGVALVLRGRDAGGGALAAAAVAVKSSSGIVLPFLVLGARRRRRALAGAAAVGVAAVVTAAAVFGSQAAGALGVLSTQQGLEAGTTVIAQLGDWLGWTGDPPAARVVAGVLLAAAMGFLLWRTWRGAQWVESAGWATLGVLVATSWLLAWYVVWLLPLAALARSRPLRLATVAMSVFVVATRVGPFVQIPTKADVRPLLHPAACVGSGRAGCPGAGARTTPAALELALARAFKRAYLAERRMVAGRLGLEPVRDARFHCRPVPGSRGGRWACRVKYFLRARPERHLAAYATSVDRRGCFIAISHDFAPVLPERVLGGRPARDPLVRVSSCP